MMTILIDIIRIVEDVSAGNLYIAAFLVGSICMVLTFVGAIPSVLGKRVSPTLLDSGLGFSAGIMIVASFTSLLLPAIDIGGIVPTLMGFIIGAFAIYLIENLLPHEHLVKGYEGPEHFKHRVKAIWMTVIAIVIHNFPEGLAVGASVVYDLRTGIMTAIAIGIQDIPEGLAVTLPLILMGKRVRKVLLIGFLSGASEPIMALIPVLITAYSFTLLPYVLGFGAGAMVYVISHEVIPESHRHGNENLATLGLLIGFIIMLILDVLL
jgi:ZIP family zinc transporter